MLQYYNAERRKGAEWLLEQVLSLSLVEVDFSDICLSFFWRFVQRYGDSNGP